MFSRAVLLLLLSCIASSLAAELLRNLETPTEHCKEVSSLSEAAILVSVAACALGSVAIVIVPTILYYKYCNKQLEDEVY